MIVTHQYLPYSKLGLYSPWLFRSRSNKETNICEFGAFALICNTIHLYSSPTRFNYLADFKIGWDQRRLRCWTNTTIWSVICGCGSKWYVVCGCGSKTYENSCQCGFMIMKSTRVREVWSLAHCQSNPTKSSCPSSGGKSHYGYWINTLEHITQK